MTRPALLCLSLLLPLAGPVGGATLADPDEIVRRANLAAYYAGGDGRSEARMVISDAQGRQQLRQFTVLRRNVAEPGSAEAAAGGDQEFLVVFSRPSDVRGTVYLVEKHVDRDDDRWLYLPALDVQKRIAASDKRTSFAGSNFFYEDVSGRRPSDDRHELVEVTDTYYVLKNTPVDPTQVEFDSYTMWIHQASYIPVKVEYEKDGEVYRVAETLGVQQIQGYPTVTRSRMTDLRTGGSTTLDYSSVEYDVGLSDDLFTERYLRSAPAEYVK